MSRLLRCGLVLTATSGAMVALGWWLLPAARSGGAGFDDRLSGACAAAGLVAATWLWTATAAVVVEAARAGGQGPASRRHPLVPAAARRVVLAACGAATLAGLNGLTGPAAHADPPGRPGPVSTVASVVARALRDSGPADRAGRPSPGPDGLRAGHPGGLVTVAHGDCLWDLAARDLRQRDGPHAARVDDADVDRRWREIYAANRAVIGPNPDLIHPAQRLRLPR